MAHTIEIELRYEVLDSGQIDSFFASSQQLGRKRVVDVYWDNPERTLWKRGIFIRTRNDQKLDIKFNRECLENMSLGHLDYCEEYSFTLPLEEKDVVKLNSLIKSLDLQQAPMASYDSFLSANNFEEHYVVDKVRTSYKHGSFTVAVDVVADLGTFLEIELMSEHHAHIEQVKHEMHVALAGLKLKPLRLGYCSMVLKKNQYECYRQGRYALQEDKLVQSTEQL
jgi:adenylate cyclase class IV